MKQLAPSAGAASFLVALTLAAPPLASGCAVDPHQRDAPASHDGAHPVSQSFSFRAAGVTAVTHVDRRAAPGGGETLRGTTTVGFSGEPHPMSLVESAELDATGRLVLAMAELRRGTGELVRSVRLDAAGGRVTVRSADGEASWPVAADMPWLYERAFGSAAPEMGSATPVQAWLARRAAGAGPRVRVIDVEERSSHVTRASQVVLDDGASQWVIVGDEAFEMKGDVIRDVPWKALEAAAAARVASLSPGCPARPSTP